MNKETVLDINVSPKSSRSRITIEGDDNIKVYLNSPPVEGKANEELIKILSKKLKLSKSGISIVKGEKSRKKRILIKSMLKEDILNLLRNSK
jgi:uncharacterized protein (TIGR00251 family)